MLGFFSGGRVTERIYTCCSPYPSGRVLFSAVMMTERN
nr:MAG TPA: hypothetical protein [Caudoviricetes sp.]